jgi:hypothetical protein
MVVMAVPFGEVAVHRLAVGAFEFMCVPSWRSVLVLARVRSFVVICGLPLVC